MDYRYDEIQGRGVARHQSHFALLAVVTRRQTYFNLAYLVAAFPLGIFYFVVLVDCFSLGFATAIIGIGFVLLAATLFAAWGFATFERELVMWWLNVRIAPMAPPVPPGASLWNRFVLMLRNAVTWKALAYLMVEFPFGVFSFATVVAVVSLALSLLLSPIMYLMALALNRGLSDQFQLRLVFGITISGLNVPLFIVATIVLSVLGFILLIGALYAFNGLAFVWGQFARVMLGMNDNARRLAEAQATAVRERTRAERADLSRRELIVNVSHELRTPIANISGHVESLLMSEDQGASDENTRHYLEIVAREAERLSSLVDDLLALARADADELKLDVRPIAAGEVVEEVYQSLAPLAMRDRQVKVVCSVAPEFPPALADRDRLAQVLLNLVRNAIIYTPSGGIVSISLSREDASHLAITVADTGIGIPPEDLARVFDRFYRTDASRTRASGGFGLGLSIARDLVQAMGGSISAASAPGEGSQFRVVLRTV
ncbi:MAG TPA: ATP-binding protein [Ktedonobacterales bacterium]|jgi:signal transduction histidine kinase